MTAETAVAPAPAAGEGLLSRTEQLSLGLRLTLSLIALAAATALCVTIFGVFWTVVALVIVALRIAWDIRSERRKTTQT